MFVALFFIVIIGAYIGLSRIHKLETQVAKLNRFINDFNLSDEDVKLITEAVDRRFTHYNKRIDNLEFRADQNPLLSDIALRAIVDEAVPDIVKAVEKRFAAYDARVTELEGQLAELSRTVEK